MRFSVFLVGTLAFGGTACRNHQPPVPIKRDAPEAVASMSAATRPAQSPSPKPSVAPPTAAPANAAATNQGVPTTLPAALGLFFAAYTDGTNFEFLRRACRPKLERFITLEDVTVDAVIRDARAFFRDKRELRYEVVPGSVRSRPGDGDTTVYLLRVRMHWSSSAPPGLAPHVVAWGTDTPIVTRDVTAEAEIVLDHDQHIVSYKELQVLHPWLRVTGEYNCDTADRGDELPPPWLDLRTDTRVEDFGETVIIGFNTKGADVARKVRYGNKVGWTLDSVAFAVENPYGGTSAGGSDCLAPVAEGGRPGVDGGRPDAMIRP